MVVKAVPKQGGYYGRRKLARKILGGKCAKCGSTEKLQFDHIDPKTKSFPISKMWSLPWSKFLQELKKCQLLCENCHNRKNAKERRDDITHGAYHAYYRLGCKCKTCVLWHRWYNEQRRLKRAGVWPNG